VKMAIRRFAAGRLPRKIRGLAQDLVDQLLVALTRAVGGTFREHVDGAGREVAERALMLPGLVRVP
jgi:hypothetical protein